MAEANLLNLIDTFNAAPFQQGGWQQALFDLAAATGSKAAQLIGFSEDAQPFFNHVADLEPDWIASFLAAGGGLSSVNPRLGAGVATPVLQTLTDDVIVDRRDRSRHEFYNEVLPLSRTAHFCGTTLIRDSNMLVGLAVLRRAQEGEITEPQHRFFKSIAPHVRTAFRTQLLLQDHGVTMLAGALEALELTAFLCDRDGQVQTMTPSAEALVLSRSPLQLKAGRLSARYGASGQILSELIGQVAGWRPSNQPPASRQLVIRDSLDAPLALDIVPVPVLACQLDFQPRALVLVRDGQLRRENIKQLLAAAYGMTESESAVALLLADGLHPESIAAHRNVSSGTVRIQLKSLYAKCDVHSQIELLARLRPFL